MKRRIPVTVTVTGAAGSIGYASVFRIAAGAMLGHDQPVALRLLELPQAISGAVGTAMELDDGAFPLLTSVDVLDDPRKAFDGASFGLLVGARPRTKGMERADLLAANSDIFAAQGSVINDVAADDIRVIVVGNPANTNAAVAAANAPEVPPERFTALTRLDHNRAIAQLARRTGASVAEISRVTVWGNHSATQYPDLFHTEVNGQNAAALINDQAWIEGDFLPTVQKRGAAIIEARGSSSAASAANATLEHMKDWVHGTAEGDWVSMAVPTDGSYGVPEGIISSFPCTVAGGEYSIVQGLEIDDFSRAKIDASVAELVEEKDAVTELGLI